MDDSNDATHAARQFELIPWSKGVRRTTDGGMVLEKRVSLRFIAGATAIVGWIGRSGSRCALIL